MFLKGAPVFSKNRRTKFAAFGALIALGFLVLQGVGNAHNPEISASAECIVPTDQARITINVNSWNTDLPPDHRVHNDVVLTVTGPNSFSQTYHNAFNAANNYGFVVTIQVPADGATYSATASTSQFWGAKGDIVIDVGPQSRSTTVTVPQPCLPATTTTAPTTTAAPTTAAPTTTIAAAPTTIPTQVEGIVETAPTTTVVGTAVLGVVLARTGTNAMPLLFGGIVLVLLGTAVELNARRRRNA
jgi:hypothetical protein